jgi:uncharacterized membrane protein YczE
MTAPDRAARLLVGIALVGIAFALIVQAHLGLGPLHVLLQGGGRRLGLSIGQASIVVNLVLLLVATALRERSGIGSLMSIVLGGILVDAFLLVVPEPRSLVVRSAMMVGGLAVMAFGAALYMSADLGASPYDAVMVGIYRRVSWSLSQVRIGLEVLSLAAGWVAGGEVGVGCVVIGLGIGPGIELSLRLLRAVPEKLDPTYQQELDAHALVGPTGA